MIDQHRCEEPSSNQCHIVFLRLLVLQCVLPHARVRRTGECDDSARRAVQTMDRCDSLSDHRSHDIDERALTGSRVGGIVDEKPRWLRGEDDRVIGEQNESRRVWRAQRGSSLVQRMRDSVNG